MLHVTLNMMQRAQPKQNASVLLWGFFHSEEIKIDHFKPPASSDVTKIKDTFYIVYDKVSLVHQADVLVL